MIRINLLPPGRPGRAVPLWWRQLPWKKIAAAAGGLLAVGSAWVLVAVQNQTHSLSRLRMEWEALQPERIKLEQRQTMLQALRNRESILNNLKTPEGRWARRLNFLSDRVVSDLWFVGFNFSTSTQDLQDQQLPGMEEILGQSDSDGSSGEGNSPPAGWKPVVVLAGSALVSGQEAKGSPVSRFLQKLKEHPEFGRWFSGAELKAIRHRQVKSEEVSDFVIFLYPTGT